MKLLVNEIPREILFELKTYFVEEEEILFLEYASDEHKSDDCEYPYYIEASIKKIDEVLRLCNDVSHARHPEQNKFKWNDFCLFWALVLSIYKQNMIGKKVNDLEYLYEINKDKYDLVLTNSSSLNRNFTEDIDVLYGKSSYGEMFLYKMDLYFDFAFSVTFSKNNNLYDQFKNTNHSTHWHPSNFFEANDYLNDFMSNSERIYNFLKKYN